MNVAFVAAHAYRAAVEIVVAENVENRIGKDQVEHQGAGFRNPKNKFAICNNAISQLLFRF